MLAVALTLAVQGVPTKAQKHVVTEMHDIDNVLQALLGDMKLERASALAEKNVAVEMLTLDQFKAKVRASETDPVPTDADAQFRGARAPRLDRRRSHRHRRLSWVAPSPSA